MNPEEGKVTDVDTEPFAEQKSGCGNGITSSREKNLVIIAFVFGLLVLCLLCAIIMTVVIGLLFPKRELCLTDHCVKKAGSILRTMDTTVDPCVDFFKFACGGWMDEYDVDENSETAIMGKMQIKIYRTLDRIIEGVKASLPTVNLSDPKQIAEAGLKAIDSYDACNQLSTTYDPEKIIPFMASFGGWPMADDKWEDDQSLDIETRLSSLIGEFGVAPLFIIAVKPHDDDPTKNVLIMTPPALSPSFEEYLNVSAIISKKLKKVAEADIDEDVKKVIKLRNEINETLEGSTEDDSSVLKVADLNAYLKSLNINWEKLFMALLKSGKNPIDEDTVKDLTVIVQNKATIEAVLGIIESNKDFRTLSNYFATKVLLNHPLLTVNVTDPTSNTQAKAFKKNNILTSLKANCLETVSQYLNFALDHVFVYNKPISTSKAEELIKYIRIAFTQLIRHYTWLDGTTRRALLKKLQKMNNFIDYPPWITDKEKLNEYYNEYTYTKENPVATYFSMVAFGVHKSLETYNQISSRDKWPEISAFSISAVNAFYIPHQNNFVLPRSILNPPIYDENNPNYLSFGSIGAVIGHEITHGFDSQGRNYDEIGKLSPALWTPTSTSEYNTLSQCFVKQYNKYEVGRNVTVNGEKTLAENIADNGGLRQALRAYRLWLKQNEKELPLPGLAKYTSEQMFFISYGQSWCISAGKKYLKRQVKTDEHTPNTYRVIGTLSNMEEFAKEFQCEKSTPMNPVDKCVLW